MCQSSLLHVFSLVPLKKSHLVHHKYKHIFLSALYYQHNRLVWAACPRENT